MEVFERYFYVIVCPHLGTCKLSVYLDTLMVDYFIVKKALIEFWHWMNFFRDMCILFLFALPLQIFYLFKRAKRGENQRGQKGENKNGKELKILSIPGILKE